MILFMDITLEKNSAPKQVITKTSGYMHQQIKTDVKIIKSLSVK
jgi:hypothetical protein